MTNSVKKQPKCTLSRFDALWVRSETPIAELEVRWEDLWERLDLVPRTGMFETVISRWTESARFYHTPRHLLETLKVLDVIGGYVTPQQKNIVELALWYHDAIYNPKQHDNEEKSAELVYSTYEKSGGSIEVADFLKKLVISTKHQNQVRTIESAIVLDADLAILGSTADRYDVYEADVRQEYSFVEEKFFIQSRVKILKSFLARRQIYRTPLMRNLLEERARKNIERSIDRLEALLEK